ncbi:MAG: hypothetical protein K8F25_10360, partial [Fimbriimonadaceae bacterium]|nr:hypothetical protein [Alphaproteobacteria bacterium]
HANDETFRSRFRKGWKGSLEKVAETYCETICRLYRLTDPVTDWGIEKKYPNKDLEAFRALQFAGQLLGDLAGWAIDHQAGKAALNIPHRFPMFPQGMAAEAVGVLEKLKPIVQSDVPEKTGGPLRRQGPADKESTLSVEQQRQFLCSFFAALNGGLGLPLLNELIDALEGLNIGETKPLLQVKRRSKNWTRAHCKLESLEYVEFWHAFDQTKNSKYYKDVWDAFDENPDPHNPNDEEHTRTVRRYKEQAVKHLGLLLVESRLAMARNAASNVRAGELDESWRKSTMDSYSVSRLQEIGKRFRSG